MTVQPKLGDRVRLAVAPKGPIYTVVGSYIDGEVPGVVLQGGDQKKPSGPKLHRPVADLAAGEGDR